MPQLPDDPRDPAGAPLATEPEILRAIRNIIVEVMSETTPLEPDDIHADWSIDGLPLAMDSVEFFRMIIAIENHFGVTMPDADCSVAAMPTVGSVAAAVKRRLAEPADTA